MSNIKAHTCVDERHWIDDISPRKRFYSTIEYNPFNMRKNILLDFDAQSMIDDKDNALKSMDDLDDETEENNEEEEIDNKGDNNTLLILVSSRTDSTNALLYSDLIYD